MTRITGILVYPLGEDYGLAALRPRTLRRAYRRALFEKSNPRPPQYMRDLFTEMYPNGTIEDDVPDGAADEIVLLYPDAIGLGFRPLERRLPSGARIRVLNGRRRGFALDRRMRRALYLRRALERSMAGEAIALAVALVVTPALLVADLLQGRR